MANRKSAASAYKHRSQKPPLQARVSQPAMQPSRLASPNGKYTTGSSYTVTQPLNRVSKTVSRVAGSAHVVNGLGSLVMPRSPKKQQSKVSNYKLHKLSVKLQQFCDELDAEE